jgi:hypothetical protein
MINPTRRAALIVALALTLAACAQKESAPQTAAEPSIPFRPTASIQDLMLAEIDTSADVLWESVAIISSEKGTEERQPAPMKSGPPFAPTPSHSSRPRTCS